MPKTPFQTCLARAQSVREAKTLLRDALAQERHDELVGGDYPYDLDLAGMLFPLHNEGLRPDAEETGNLPHREVGALFADAAWELCLEGLLRPGSRSPMDKTTTRSTGFCLTERGRAALLARSPREVTHA